MSVLRHYWRVITFCNIFYCTLLEGGAELGCCAVSYYTDSIQLFISSYHSLFVEGIIVLLQSIMSELHFGKFQSTIRHKMLIRPGHFFPVISICRLSGLVTIAHRCGSWFPELEIYHCWNWYGSDLQTLENQAQWVLKKFHDLDPR